MHQVACCYYRMVSFPYVYSFCDAYLDPTPTSHFLDLTLEMPRDNTRPTAPAADGVGAPLLERRRSSGFASPSMERVGSHIGSPLLEKSEAEAQIEEIR